MCFAIHQSRSIGFHHPQPILSLEQQRAEKVTANEEEEE
jgi:hypothetical protein